MPDQAFPPDDVRRALAALDEKAKREADQETYKAGDPRASAITDSVADVDAPHNDARLMDVQPVESRLDVSHLSPAQKIIVYRMRDARDPQELIQAFMDGVDTLNLRSFTEVTQQINREWIEPL